MKKVLIVANTDRHILLCHQHFINELKAKGYTVHVATNTNKSIHNVDKKICIPITRSPFHFSNIKAIKQLKKIIEDEQYDIIHCHTPMGGAVARLAAKQYHKITKKKLYYTAHGFHFYHGAPLKNWLLYYPVEKILSKECDIIFTMNKEDFSFAKKHFKTKIVKINGIGFDEDKLTKTNNQTIKLLKKQYHISKDDFTFVYVAEISNRKRQKYLVRAFSKIDLQQHKIKLLLVGDSNGDYDINKWIIKYHLEKNIIWVSFKEKISPYIDLADAIISVSKQEGMPLNILEAIYKNKLIIATDVRGQNDLLNNQNSFLISLKNQEQLVRTLLQASCSGIINQEKQKKLKELDITKYYYQNVNKDIMKYYDL